MESRQILATFNSDWLVHVLLDDMRVYSFQTEMWWQHEDGGWDAVISRAKDRALFLAQCRNNETWSIPRVPANDADFFAMLDTVCEHTSDYDFGRFVRH